MVTARVLIAEPIGIPGTASDTQARKRDAAASVSGSRRIDTVGWSWEATLSAGCGSQAASSQIARVVDGHV
ncbi:MAG: hypothetical protein ACOYBY_15340 [Dermatophilaceae bacterium]